ncbi:MAG TPA: globin family protein [Chthonomonadaceae bacterium]|nr:globin family protein [Chthonomonadaceae bacterium]
MTPEQKTLIRSSFEALAPDADTFAALFYRRLFELDPSLRSLFKISFREQRRKFVDMIHSVVQSLDHLDEIVMVVWQSGKRHGGYGVRAAHYDTVGEALLWALAQQLGEAYTPAMEAAWKEIYGVMATAMKQAASEGSIPRRDVDEVLLHGDGLSKK